MDQRLTKLLIMHDPHVLFRKKCKVLDDLLLKEGGVVKRTLARSTGRKPIALAGGGPDAPLMPSFPSRHARVAFLLEVLNHQPEQDDPYMVSLETEMEPWRRSYTLEVIKATVVDGNLARFLHTAYDARDGDSHKMIFRDSVLMMVRVTRAGLSPQPESGVEDILAAVTVLHRTKGKAEDVVPEDEGGAAHIAFSVFLALEGVMGAAHVTL